MSINSNKANEFITTDRRDLIKALLDRYQSLGGEVQNSSEVSEIYPEDNQLILSDNRKQKAEVILACDGIRSNIRGRYFDNSKPIFTNFLAWRGLTDISNLPDFEDSHEINLYYGPGGHVVHYPTGKEGTVNFVGIRESKKCTKESWREEGSKADLLKDFKGWNSDLLKLMTSPQNLYKWGIFERPKIKSIKNKNIILLGDAAHPMVPFMGQGGCMAIEDSYTFGELYSKLESQEEALNKYQKIRLKRGNWIQRRSNMQAKFNHLSSPFLVKVRNLLVDKMSINGVKAVHSYDAHKEVLKVLKS
jgi:salicylate hydroxylase